jgi:hypothetical protein
VLQAKHIGKADPFAVKEAALTDTQHAQYLSVPDQFEQWTQDVQNLSPRLAYVKLHDAAAVRIKTLTVPDAQADARELATVLASYKGLYQRTKEEAEAAITRLPPQSREPEHDTVPAYKTLFQRNTLANKPSN